MEFPLKSRVTIVGRDLSGVVTNYRKSTDEYLVQFDDANFGLAWFNAGSLTRVAPASTADTITAHKAAATEAIGYLENALNNCNLSQMNAWTLEQIIGDINEAIELLQKIAPTED